MTAPSGTDPQSLAELAAKELTAAVGGPHDVAVVMGSGWAPAADAFGAALDLADTVGLTPVHVNRVIQSLRQDKLLEFRKYVVTLGDADHLMKLGEFDDLYLHQSPEQEDTTGRLPL